METTRLGALIVFVALSVFAGSVSSVDPRKFGIVEFAADPVKEKQLLASPPGKPRVQLESCMLGGKFYQVGEKWHPELQPFGKLNCTTCHCKENGKVSCWRKSCPRLNCRNPRIVAGKCCPICPDRKDGKARRNGGNRRRRPLTALSVGRSCTHDGSVYYDGQTFVNREQTTLTSQEADQCVQCVCVDGKTLCRLKTCRVKIRHSCQTITQGKDDCCPVCADCNYLGDTHTNGTTWHPIVDSVGQIPCITCSCLNGEVTCKRQVCPPDEQLKCSRPLLEVGQCCKTCPPSSGRPDTEAAVETSDVNAADETTPDLFGGAEDRLVSDVADDHTEEDDPFALFDQTVTSPSDGNAACLPPSTDTFVYYRQNRTAVLLVFEFRISATVYEWTYTRNKGRNVTSMYKKCISVPELGSLLTRHQGAVKLLGATTVGRVERYRRRVAKWYRKCGQNCRLRSLRRKEKTLKLTSVLYGPACAKQRRQQQQRQADGTR
ncbi:uncharacterized protein LOC141911219 [Tubulanus polymorphus]|uniref:uncharacterized protein LOC141911219 n=1 Tax=Tubulanus polymorphus TaxID=672921 RepID=UPI003DA4BE76